MLGIINIHTKSVRTIGKEGLGLFNEVQQIQEMSLLSAIRAALKFVSDLGELRSIYQPALASN